MALEGCVIRIIHILVNLVTHVARKMHPLYVVEERLIIKEKLFAEITPWMR
jgi:hypothetical protein